MVKYSYPLKSFHKKFETSFKKVHRRAKEFFDEDYFRDDHKHILEGVKWSSIFSCLELILGKDEYSELNRKLLEEDISPEEYIIEKGGFFEKGFYFLIQHEFYYKDIPSIYFEEKELKQFLLDTESVKDYTVIKDYIEENSIKNEQANEAGIFLSMIHFRIPDEKDAYTYLLFYDKVDNYIAVLCTQDLNIKTFVNDLEKEKPINFTSNEQQIKLLFNYIYYVHTFPDALIEGKPVTAEADKVHAFFPKFTIKTTDKIIEKIDRDEKGRKVTHFRRGHFRVLRSDYFVNKHNKVVFVKGSIVHGKPAKTLI